MVSIWDDFHSQDLTEKPPPHLRGFSATVAHHRLLQARLETLPCFRHMAAASHYRTCHLRGIRRAKGPSLGKAPFPPPAPGLTPVFLHARHVVTERRTRPSTCDATAVTDESPTPDSYHALRVHTHRLFTRPCNEAQRSPSSRTQTLKPEERRCAKLRSRQEEKQRKERPER